MLEHPQISISQEQNRSKLVRQSTVFRSECLELSSFELEKILYNSLSLHRSSFCKSFPNQIFLGFQRLWKSRLLKILQKKKKMFITSIFSFSHNVFCLFEKNYTVCATLKLSSSKAFNFDKAESLLSGKG